MSKKWSNYYIIKCAYARIHAHTSATKAKVLIRSMPLTGLFCPKSSCSDTPPKLNFSSREHDQDSIADAPVHSAPLQAHAAFFSRALLPALSLRPAYADCTPSPAPTDFTSAQRGSDTASSARIRAACVTCLTSTATGLPAPSAAAPPSSATQLAALPPLKLPAPPFPESTPSEIFFRRMPTPQVTTATPSFFPPLAPSAPPFPATPFATFLLGRPPRRRTRPSRLSASSRISCNFRRHSAILPSAAPSAIFPPPSLLPESSPHLQSLLLPVSC